MNAAAPRLLPQHAGVLGIARLGWWPFFTPHRLGCRVVTSNYCFISGVPIRCPATFKTSSVRPKTVM